MFTMKFWHNFLNGSIQCEPTKPLSLKMPSTKVDQPEVSRDNIDLNPKRNHRFDHVAMLAWSSNLGNFKIKQQSKKLQA